MYIRLDVLKLFHHSLINMKPSGRIQDHHAHALLLRMLHCRFRNVYRLMLVSHGKYFHTLLLTIYL